MLSILSLTYATTKISSKDRIKCVSKYRLMDLFLINSTYKYGVISRQMLGADYIVIIRSLMLPFKTELNWSL